MAFCINVIPRCKPICDDVDIPCDVQTPKVILYDSVGNDISEDRVVYFGATYKLQIVNHQEMVDAGFAYDYRVYANGAELDNDGYITWVEPNSNIGASIIQSRQLYFSFYRDNKCYSTLTYTIYPREGIITVLAETLNLNIECNNKTIVLFPIYTARKIADTVRVIFNTPSGIISFVLADLPPENVGWVFEENWSKTANSIVKLDFIDITNSYCDENHKLIITESFNHNTLLYSGLATNGGYGGNDGNTCYVGNIYNYMLDQNVEVEEMYDDDDAYVIYSYEWVWDCVIERN